MSAVVPMIGKRFDRLLVVAEVASVTGVAGRRYECMCDCGKSKVIRGAKLRDGGVRSCGCLALQGSLEERFWRKVNKKIGTIPAHVPHLGPCWIWVGTKTNRRYGRMLVETRPDGSKHSEQAHRISWYLAHGRWPNPFALHRCDNPACVRPDHLFEGSQADNNADKESKGRANHLRGDSHPARLHPERMGKCFGDRNGTRLHPDRVRRGGRHGQAKLSETQALEIIRRKAAGERQLSLAREFGVTQTVISSVGRKTWLHVNA